MRTRLFLLFGLVFTLIQTPVLATTFYDFHGTSPPDGSAPVAALINVNNVFYGTTSTGGAHNSGTVFSITAGNVVNTIYSFQGGLTDGAGPDGELLEIGGVLYGTTGGGGAYSGGTIFSMPIYGGSDQILHSFHGTPGDGFFPHGSLVNIGTDLYGTTSDGGTGIHCDSVSAFHLCGTIFRQSICTCGSGNYATLYSFKGPDHQDGGTPYGGLTYWRDAAHNIDWLYGTTAHGGQPSPTTCPLSQYSGGCGTVFRIKTSGANEQVLHSFVGTDGALPYDTRGLLIDNNDLYGTTYYGGAQNDGTVFTERLSGANYHVISSFNNYITGQYPSGTPILHRDTLNHIDYLYGTTTAGGTNTNCTYPTGCGILYKMKLDGSSASNVFVFNNPTGGHPYSGVTYWLDPVSGHEWLYGTTYEGGTIASCPGVTGCGAAYQVTP